MNIDNIRNIFTNNNYRTYEFFINYYIVEFLRIKKDHDVIIVVDSLELSKVNAALAYGFNKTKDNVLVSYYNKHILRKDFELTYTLSHVNDNTLQEKLLEHALWVTKSLVSLAESNKK